MNTPNDRNRMTKDVLARFGESTSQMLDFGGVNDRRSSRNTPGNHAFHWEMEPERVWQSPSRRPTFVERENRDQKKIGPSPIKKKSPPAAASTYQDPLLGKIKPPCSPKTNNDCREICLPALNTFGPTKEIPAPLDKTESSIRPQRQQRQLVYGAGAFAFAPEITSPPKDRRTSFRSHHREENVAPIARNKVTAAIPMMNEQQEHHHQHPPHSATTPQRLLLLQVDIGGGTSVPLVGSEATVRALHQDRCIHVICGDCETFLYCVDSVSMVLCPECRSISPIACFNTAGDTAGTAARANDPSSAKKRVGLGLTVEHVAAEFHRLNLSSETVEK